MLYQVGKERSEISNHCAVTEIFIRVGRVQGRLFLIGALLVSMAAVAGCGERHLSGDGTEISPDLDVEEADGDDGQPQEIGDPDLDDTGDADGDSEPIDVLACPALDPGSLGDCGISLGFAFDGESCSMAVGCACESPACRVFSSRVECAEKCAEAGRCNLGKMPREHTPSNEPVRVGDVCDVVNVCATEPTLDTENDLRALVTGITCPPTAYRSDCEPPICDVNVDPPIDEALYHQMCAATMLSEVTHLGCTIYL